MNLTIQKTPFHFYTEEGKCVLSLLSLQSTAGYAVPVEDTAIPGYSGFLWISQGTGSIGPRLAFCIDSATGLIYTNTVFNEKIGEIFVLKSEDPKLLPLRDWSHTAWSPADMPQIEAAITEKQWIILGGDILSPARVEAGDNWFYQPQWNPTHSYHVELRKNVEESISRAEEYLNRYLSVNGPDFLFSLTVCEGPRGMLYAIKRHI